MAVIKTHLLCELHEAVKVQYLDGVLFSQDNQANEIVITVLDNGQPATLSGTVSANIIRSDGGTVAATGGSISGNVVSITLPAEAYYVPGVVSVAVKITASGVVTTIAAFVATMYRSSTDTAVDPGTIIPSIQTLINQINTAVASIPADYSSLWTKLAPAFSTDASYVTGQYVTYNSGLYRFNTTHSGAWSSSDVTAVNLGGEISDLKSAFVNVEDNLADLIVPIVTADDWELGGIYAQTGKDYPYENQIRTGYKVIGEKVSVSFTGSKQAQNGGARVYYAFFYDENYNFISPRNNDTPYTIPSGAKFVRFIYGFNSTDGRTVAGYGFENLVNDWSISCSNATNHIFKERSTPVSITLLSSLRESGIYALNGTVSASITDFPDDSYKTSVSTLEVYAGAFNGSYSIQVLTGNDKAEWRRVINTSTGEIYINWYISKPSNGFSSVFMDRDIGSSRTLADYVLPGEYKLTSSVFHDITDAPEDALDENHTLLVYSNAFSSNYVIQQLIQFDHNRWERIVNRTTHQVYTDWVRIDAGAQNVLYGKKLVTAGDSYTAASYTGDYSEYNGKNYGYYISQRNRMKFVNAGIAGSTMTAGTGSSNPFSVDRYSNIPSDTDYLTIWFGINDSGLDLPVGTIDDTENTTFYGAWNKVLKYYLDNYPFMKVLIIVSTGTKSAYRQAVVDVAQKWGYPYMNWVDDYSIPAFFNRTGISEYALEKRRDAFGWNDFNAHPNPQWHVYESSIIEHRLRSI